jgi:hypothetical protein
VSGSTEPRAVLVSPKDQGTFMALMDKERVVIGFDELNVAVT